MIYNGLTTEQSYERGEVIASGGSGQIWTVGDGYVAKIYYDTELSANPALRDRVIALAGRRPRSISATSAAWPREALLNEQGRVVGYVMEDIRTGMTLQDLQEYPAATAIAEADKVEIALGIVNLSIGLERGIRTGGCGSVECWHPDRGQAAGSL